LHFQSDCWISIPLYSLTAGFPFHFHFQTDCWIADPADVYIRGKITKTAKDTCTVEAASGVSKELGWGLEMRGRDRVEGKVRARGKW
jgi:hypothetical protein